MNLPLSTTEAMQLALINDAAHRKPQVEIGEIVLNLRPPFHCLRSFRERLTGGTGSRNTGEVGVKCAGAAAASASVVRPRGAGQWQWALIATRLPQRPAD